MAAASVGPWRALFSRLFLAIVGFFALTFLAAAGSGRLLPGVPADDALRLVMVGAFLLGASVVMAVSTEARTWLRSQVGLAATHWRVLVLAALAGVAFHAVYFQIAGYDGSRIHGWRPDLQFLFGSLLLSACLVSLVEETFFRGIAIGDSRGGPALVAALVSAAVFSAIHPERWLSVFVFSLLASAIYLRAGLFGAHAFHAAYNLANYITLAWISTAR